MRYVLGKVDGLQGKEGDLRFGVRGGRKRPRESVWRERPYRCSQAFRLASRDPEEMSRRSEAQQAQSMYIFEYVKKF